MLKTIDLLLEHEDIPEKQVPINLELLSTGTLSIYHLDIKYEKRSDEKAEKAKVMLKRFGKSMVLFKIINEYVIDQKRTKAYHFNNQGELEKFAVYNGDFQDGNFKWDEMFMAEYPSYRNILPAERKGIYNIVERIYKKVEEMHGRAQTIQEKDYYNSFLKVFEKIREEK